MEVKVTCACGTKFKFDVEPVNRRMPWPVACPNCGADDTSLANEIISQTLPPSPAGGVPVGMLISSSPPPIAPISVSPPPPPPPRAPMPMPRAYVPPQPMAQSKSQQTKWIGLAIIAVILLAAASIGIFVVRTANKVKNFVSAIADATAQSPEDHQWNLQADDQIVIYVKHTNHTDVADASIAYFRETLHRNLRRISADKADDEGNEFLVTPPHRGYVEFTTHHQAMKDPEYEGLAKHLSEKFNTLVFMQRDIDFTGEYVFGAYETGTNSFYARSDVKIKNGDESEQVITRGNDWALAKGFKPGTNGFSGFDIKDADELTKKCGMKIWDRDYDAMTNALVMQEWGMKKQQ